MVAQALLASLSPSHCRLCGTPFRNASRPPVCSSCRLAIAPIPGTACDVCGERLPGPHQSVRNQPCAGRQESRPAFLKAAGYGAYDGAVHGAFRLVHLSRVAGRNVLVVKDVLTRGTTASACARILPKPGAAKVWIETVARSLKESTAEFESVTEYQATQAS